MVAVKKPLESQKILKTVDAIRHYIGGGNPISREQFKEFIKMGMPAVQMGVIWYAHVDNIEKWFKDKTYRTYRGVPDDIIDQAK